MFARFDAAEEMLTVWDGTQMPHRAKSVLVAALGLDENQVRVIAPDVGGGFGPKAVFHPEELAIPAAALALGAAGEMDRGPRGELHRHRPRTRSGLGHGSGLRRRRRLLAIRGHMRHDHGANTPYGVALPYNAATNYDRALYAARLRPRRSRCA